MTDGETKQSYRQAALQEREITPLAECQVELCDSLPGDRAVIAVEQEGRIVWIFSRKHATQRTVDEFRETIQRIVRDGLWVQNWAG